MKQSRTKCIAIKKEKGIYRRGEPTIEWYDENSKPQIYCRGYKHLFNDEPLKSCKNCTDFVLGAQIEKDFNNFKNRIKNV